MLLNGPIIISYIWIIARQSGITPNYYERKLFHFASQTSIRFRMLLSIINVLFTSLNCFFHLFHYRKILFYGKCEPKWVNPVLDIIGVNSLRLGGLHLVHISNMWAAIYILSKKNLKSVNNTPKSNLSNLKFKTNTNVSQIDILKN